MGHGIVANYMVAMIKGTFKTLCYQYKAPGEIATHLNKILYDEFDKMGVFATSLISVFDTENNILSVSNAGHYSPIIIDDNGEVVKVEGVLTDERWCRNRQNHWEGNVAEFLPSVGPINIGCFVKIVWNRLQDSECQDVNVREAEPTLHHNQSNFCPSRICFPRNENPIQEWENLRKERKDLRIDGPDTIVEHV